MEKDKATEKEAKDAERLRLREGERRATLQAAYELTGGLTWARARLEELARSASLPAHRVEDALVFLGDAGLVRAVGVGAYSLTHAGVLEAERAIRGPASPEAGAGVVQHFHGPVGASVVGGGATVTATQHVGAGPGELLALVAAARAAAVELPGPARAEAEERLDDAAEELRVERPRASRVRALLAGAWKHKEEGVKFAQALLELYVKLDERFPALPG